MANHSGRLDVISRDADDSQLVLRWSDAGFVTTDHDPNDPTATMTPDNARVYQAVVDFGTPVTAADLREVLPGMPKIGNRLTTLERGGYLLHVGRGRYERA